MKNIRAELGSECNIINKTHLYFQFSRQLTIAGSAGVQLQEKPQKLQLLKLHVLFFELGLNFFPSWCQSAVEQ
jgi:hypothetical protein